MRYEAAEVLLDQAICLLDRQGIRLQEPEAVDILRSAGAVRTEDGNRIHLRQRTLRRRLSHLPAAFNLYDREGRKSATLSAKRPPDAPPARWATLPATRLDRRRGEHPAEVQAAELPSLVRQITRSLLFDVYGVGPVPACVDPTLGDMYAFYLYLLGTQHPLLFRPRHPESLDRARALLAVVRGSALAFDQKPLAVVELRLSDPLCWAPASGRLLIDAARRGFPLIVMPERIVAAPDVAARSPRTGGRPLEAIVAGLLTAVVIAQESRVQAPVMWGAPQPVGSASAVARLVWSHLMDVGGLLGLPVYASLDEGTGESGADPEQSAEPGSGAITSAPLRALGASLAGAQLVAWGGWSRPDCLDIDAVDSQSNLSGELSEIHSAVSHQRTLRPHAEPNLSYLDGPLRVELAEVMRREVERFDCGPMPLSV